jgi:PEP-CTERM motif
MSGFLLLQRCTVAAGLMGAMLAMPTAGSAAVRYDFVANNSFAYNGSESFSGNFSYTAPSFLNPGIGNLNLISIPAGTLSTCSAQSTSGLATTCTDQWFMREISPGTVNIGFGITNAKFNGHINYYFGANAFTTAGSYSSTLLGQGQSGTLTVTDLSTGAVPEPSTWAMFISGFGLAGFALRTTRQRRAVLAT